jgi:Ca2+-binding RTX toxin-like protein
MANKPGTANNDTLIGTDRSDNLNNNNSAGDDIMKGLAGNDNYYINSVGDIVKELANEGLDKVISSVPYTLGNHIENLDLIGNSALNGIGNSLANTINGNKGANTLRGMDGIDTLRGADGNDKLYGDNGNDKLYGDNGDDKLYGGNGQDTLEDGTGDDSLYGGLGKDIYNLGAGNDTVFIATGDSQSNDYDVVNRFAVNKDHLHFTNTAGATIPIAADMDYTTAANPTTNAKGFKIKDGIISFYSSPTDTTPNNLSQNEATQFAQNNASVLPHDALLGISGSGHTLIANNYTGAGFTLVDITGLSNIKNLSILLV